MYTCGILGLYQNSLQACGLNKRLSAQVKEKVNVIKKIKCTYLVHNDIELPNILVYLDTDHQTSH